MTKRPPPKQDKSTGDWYFNLVFYATELEAQKAYNNYLVNLAEWIEEER